MDDYINRDDLLDKIESAVNRGECSGLADIMVIIRDAPTVKMIQERAEDKNKTLEVERA